MMTSDPESLKEPLVSVVTPFFNTGQYLPECIESVMRQSYGNWEYVLVNNQSTDGGDEVARRYARMDQRIRVVDSPRFLNQVENYNFALSLISPASEYVKVVEADNWVYPNCLQEMVGLGIAHPDVGIVSSYSVTEEVVRFTGLHISRNTLSGQEAAARHLRDGVYWFGAPTTVLMRASIVRERTPFYSEAVPIAEDLMACYDAFERWNFGFVHQVLTFVRTENDSILSRRRHFPGLMMLDRLFLLRLYGKKFLASDEYESAYRDLEKSYYRVLGRALLQGKDRDFLDFHQAALESVDASISRGSLIMGILRELAAVVFNPARSVSNALPVPRR